MGFDLYSTGNHKTEKGEYFRNNVWWWRRLADFVCEYTGVVADEDKASWQHNDGHEYLECLLLFAQFLLWFVGRFL